MQNFIVWKNNSVSTPYRLVFDASQISSTGYSLSDILAKGRNNLNKLVEIVIRWFIHKVAFHTDIQRCTTRSNDMSKIGSFNDIFGSNA